MVSKSSWSDSIFGKKILPATVYTILFSLYTVAFSFGANVSIIRLLYIPFYAISFWYFFKVLALYRSSSFIKVLTIMLLIIVAYGAALIIMGTDGSWKRQVDPTGHLFLYLSSVVPIYAFYYFGQKGMLSSMWFQVMLLVFSFDAYALYYEKQMSVMIMLMVDEGSFTNNSGYLIVSLLPLICFFQKRTLIQYSALILISIATIFCFKRGAILVGMIAITYFLFYSVRSQSSIRKALVLVFGLIGMIILYDYIENLLASNDYFYHRFMETSEGNSSGRDSIYGFFFNYFISSENGLLGFLFGNGEAATVRMLGIEAHNDWLEFAVNMGLLGISAYLIYWTRIYRYYKYAKKHLSREIVMAMGMVLIINFSRTFFSMSFNDMSFFSAALIGYTMSLVDIKKKEQIIIQSK